MSFVSLQVILLNSILLIKGRHKKLVKADKTIRVFNPTRGSKNAPDRLLATIARLLTLQSRAKLVASRPLSVFCAIKSIIIRNINIPIKL